MNQAQSEMRKYIEQQHYTYTLTALNQAFFLKIKGFFLFAILMMTFSLLAINKFLAISKLLCFGYFAIFFLDSSLLTLILFWCYQSRKVLEFSSNITFEDVIENNLDTNKAEKRLETKVIMGEHGKIIFGVATTLAISTLVLFILCVSISICCF
jgi:hypothetical protein